MTEDTGEVHLEIDQLEAKNVSDISAGHKAPPPSFVSGVSMEMDTDVRKKLEEKWKKISGGKRIGTFPYRARIHDERRIMQKMNTPPPPHDYFGYIFSKDSPRPRNLTFYSLPSVRQPTKRQKVLLCSSTIPDGVIHSMKEAPPGLPLTTVKVRWAASPRNTLYRLEDIYQILSQFGAINKVYRLSPNSALVVFEDLEPALAAVKCRDLGLPWDTLNVQWFEPRMNNYSFYRKYAHLDECCRNATMEAFIKKEEQKL